MDAVPLTLGQEFMDSVSMLDAIFVELNLFYRSL